MFYKNLFRYKKYSLIGLISILPFIAINSILSKNYINKSINKNNEEIKERNNKLNDLKITSIQWEKLELKKSAPSIEWEKISNSNSKDKSNIDEITSNKVELNSLNRSIVFNNKIIGPDISWLVPPGFKWSSKYKYDFSTRGHSRRKKGEPFLGWNGGDAVGQFYYQPISLENYSFGLNIGMRSVYSGSAVGGASAIGEGLSLGFRIDKSFSDRSGFAIGGEQLIHFDGLTDTGRDLYITFSKGWWSYNKEGLFPLNIATFGFATGKMAEGNVKGLCSDLFGGSGTETNHQRELCWAPVFTLSRVYNDKFSTFFEYNSKWFLLGTSVSPFQEIPLRGTFAIQLSDHIENYKLNNFEDLKWVFRLSLGF